jgi:hypothetical protein
MKEVVEDGAVLKYRQRKVGEKRRYAQATTLPEFSAEMDAEFYADVPSEVGKKLYLDDS